MTVGFYPSSIKPAADYIGKSSIRFLPRTCPFIRILDVNKDKPVKDQLKVIREDVLYTLNEVY